MQESRNKLSIAVILSVFFTFAGCGSEDSAAKTKPPKPFKFVVISDAHTRLPGNPDDVTYDNQKNIDNLAAAVESINTRHADASFVAVTGDLVGCLFSENPDDYGAGKANPAEKFKSLIDGLNMPYYAVLGNHDYQKTYDAEMEEGISTDNISAIEAVWNKVLGLKPYYSVVHEGVRLLFVNANRGDKRSVVCTGCNVEAFCAGSFDAEQIAWIERELANPEPVIMFLHHPLKTDNARAMFCFFKTFLVADGDPIYALLEGAKEKIMAVFAGHGHIWERDLLYGKIPAYETGSIGDGAGDARNMHVVNVDPIAKTINVKIGREDGYYWSDGEPEK